MVAFVVIRRGRHPIVGDTAQPVAIIGKPQLVHRVRIIPTNEVADITLFIVMEIFRIVVIPKCAIQDTIGTTKTIEFVVIIEIPIDCIAIRPCRGCYIPIIATKSHNRDKWAYRSVIEFLFKLCGANGGDLVADIIGKTNTIHGIVNSTLAHPPQFIVGERLQGDRGVVTISVGSG